MTTTVWLFDDELVEIATMVLDNEQPPDALRFPVARSIRLSSEADHEVPLEPLIVECPMIAATRRTDGGDGWVAIYRAPYALAK